MTDFEAEDVKTLSGTVNLFTNALENVLAIVTPFKPFIEVSPQAKDIRRIIEEVLIANNKWVNRNKFKGDKKQ